MKHLRSIAVTLCGLFAASLSTRAAIVINEIHYNPDVATEPAEFVELHNTGPAAVNLAGWTLSDGKNFDFVLPSTNVAVGGYVVVAQNPAFLQTKFAVAGVLGPFQTNRDSSLSKNGDKLTVRDPGGNLIDEVEYQLGFPWPTVGDSVVAGNGSSIELIHSSLDNNLAGSWRASGGTRPTPGRVNSVFATNAPPQIRQVEHQPEQPVAGQTVKITAKVTDPDGVASVTLQYQIVNPGSYIELGDAAYTNAANWVTLSMNDTGTVGDLAAGDEVFTADIPALVQTHRRLIRYRITVADTTGRSVRVPYTDDPQPNFAYFCYDGVPAWTGAVQPGGTGSNAMAFTVTSEEMNRLPAYHLIARSNSFATAIGWAPGQPNNKYGGDDYLWTGALVVDGTVYDHIGFRCRGGVWRYSMGKNAMKFRLNRGHDLEVKDNWGRKLNAPWRRLSLRANIQQGDFNHRGEQGMFEAVGYRMFELAGTPSLKTVQLQLRVIDDARQTVPGNQYQSDFYGLWLAVEEEDGRFLEERDLPDGNIYDMEGGTGTLNHTGPTGPLDKSDLSFLMTYGGASPTEAWWRTNLNLQAYYSYQAIVQGIHHYDIADGKNYFYYRNPVTRLWTVLPWDLDLTWADNMYQAGVSGGGEPFKSRVVSGFANPGTFPAISTEFRNRVREIRDLFFNNSEAFRLLDEYARVTRGTNRYSIIDADRAMWDYNPVMIDGNIINPSKAGQGRFYQQGTPTKDFAGMVQLMKNYVNYRSTNAVLASGMAGLDGIATDNQKPARPTITYTGPAGYPLNRLTFQSSAYSGANPFGSMRWRVGEITDTNSANFNPNEPHKYEIEPVWDSGRLSPFSADIQIPANVLRVGSRYRVRVLHTDNTGRNSNWSPPIEFTCGASDNSGDLLNYLRLTEVMYNPPFAGYEFIELYNSSATTTLDLGGVKFTQGVDYTFAPGVTLVPGAYLVVVGTSDSAGFRAYYGIDGTVAIYGPYNGSLNNAGEQLVLRTAAGGLDIVNFSYGDGRGWPVTADGTGHSIVLLDSAISGQGMGAGEYAGNWRASTFLKGSPGGADAVPAVTVLLNEIVAHTDFTNEFDSNDWIELYNPTDSPITLGPGWYLSDDGAAYTNLMKWAIPANTTIPARGWVSFDEVTGFHNPTNIGFGLNKAGEQVFLSYLPGNAQDRVVDAVSFKGQENEWSLGRYPDGGPFWYALTPRTREAANAAPPARVVVSEVMFRPPDFLVGTNFTDNSLDEFIELHNGTGGAVALHNTNGTWRLNGGADFTFPTNVTMAAGEYLLVVNFDPATNATQSAAFKSFYGITDPNLRIFGPYNGKLANNSDRVALERPQHPDATNDTVNWVIVDEVLYADQAPWPCGSDGTGNSLQRLSAIQHGNDPINWAAEPPTAGLPRANLPAGLPAITAPPQDRIAPTNGAASFSVSVCGTPPFAYQWQFNAGDIAGATDTTLNLANLTLANAGAYRVVVSNPAGSITSQVATLIVQLPPFITTQPQPATTIRDQSASFSVTAGGTQPIYYQWRFNGANIPGATNSVLLLTNVQASQAGNYSVLVANTAASILSSNALLTVQIPSTITQQPTNRSVTLGASPVSTTFTVGAIGTGTLRYQWRFNGVDIPGATSTNYTIAAVQVSDDGDYSVVVTDNIGPAISQNARLSVLVAPGIVVHPVSQAVVQGGNVTFSVQVSGSPLPFTFEWRKGSIPLAGQTFVLNDRISFCTLTNVQTNVTTTSGPGAYRVVVKNPANPAPGIVSASANLTVLPDADGDGIPDAWESSYGFNPASNSDRTADADGDGMKNWEEYVAGTDPTNAVSYLKVENVWSGMTSNQQVRLEFNAVANKTYTVLSRDSLTAGVWNRLADVVANSLDHVVQIPDQRPSNSPPRFYRLVTPRAP